MHAFAWRRQVWYEIWCHSKCHAENLSFILHGGGAYDKFLLLVESTFIQNAFLYVYKDFRPFFIVHVSFSAWKSWEDVQSLILVEILCKFCDYEIFNLPYFYLLHRHLCKVPRNSLRHFHEDSIYATDLHWTFLSDIHDWFVYRSNRWRELYITLLYWICC